MQLKLIHTNYNLNIISYRLIVHIALYGNILQLICRKSNYVFVNLTNLYKIRGGQILEDI